MPEEHSQQHPVKPPKAIRFVQTPSTDPNDQVRPQTEIGISWDDDSGGELYEDTLPPFYSEQDILEVVLPTTAQRRAIHLQEIRRKEISSYDTLEVEIPPQSSRQTTPAQHNEPFLYGSTAGARRVEKQRRAEEKHLNWHDLRQFSQFITPFKWQIGLGFLLTVAIGLTALPMPFIFRIMLDEVFQKRDIPLFIWLLVLLLLVLLLEEVLRFLTRIIVGSLSRAANLHIIYRFYRHMLRLPLSFYQNLSSTGELLSRLNEVTTAQQTVIQVVIDIAVNCILALIFLGVLCLTDWHLTLAVLGIAPCYIGTSLYFNRKARRWSRRMLESYALMNGAMYEGLSALKTVKALAAEHRFGRSIKKLIIQTNRLSFQRSIFQAGTTLAVGAVQALGIIAILSYGGYLVLHRDISAGQLAAFILVLREMASPLSTLNGANQQIQTAAVAIDRLFEILHHPLETDAEKGIELHDVRGHIMMKNVSFAYTPNVEVLHNINLDVPPGTTIAFVGRSGAGKTTIANLLMRFYSPHSGSISLDGYDLRDLKIETVRQHFGIILQDDSLFSGTIADNLTFGLLQKVTAEEMKEAARNANILDFIQEQPQGFHTVLKERGQNLSSGQRQRLAIARMFLRQPKILIMDEPSSALDNESELLIQQALSRLTRDRTTFIIAHRLSTIRDADRIVIIDKGCIAEQGTHTELLAHQGIYWQLYNSYGRV